jgi:hypothetical protein
MGGTVPPLFESRMLENMKALKIVFSVICVVYAVRLAQAIIVAIEGGDDD